MSLPKELIAACDVQDKVGHVKRVIHLQKYDGSPCSEGKDACLSIHRVHDGWMYKCFRCGMRGKVKFDAFSPTQTVKYLEAETFERAPVVTNYNGMFISMPWDQIPIFRYGETTPREDVPLQAAQWLYKYRIDNFLASKYGIMWSPSYKRIIFPIRGTAMTDINNMGWNAVYGWIGRSLEPKTPTNPKWLKRVRKDSPEIGYHILGKFRAVENEKSVVIVEDAVSAIRVAESGGCHAIALLGTNMNHKMISRLREMNVTIWLDADAYIKGLHMWKRLNTLGVKATHLSTTYDPKCYADEMIRIYTDLK